MTNTSKPVRRETLSSIRERGKTRPIIVELASTYVRCRLKGTRRVFVATYAQVWMLAVRNEIEARKREREEARKAKRKERE
jgi:hypothetical protein